MKTRRLLTSLALGLGSAVTLLGLLGNELMTSAYAQGQDGYHTYYVVPGGRCSGMIPCFDSVQAAVDAVDDPTDVVKIAAGHYAGVTSRQGMTQVVYLDKTLTLRGGYTTTNWGTPNPASNLTRLDARGQGRVLFIGGAGTITPTIENLHILGGVADWEGGGIYIHYSSPTISGNIIISNQAVYGGGIGIRYGSPLLNHNMVVSNSASNYGGGIYVLGPSATIMGNWIMRNTTFNNGGGVFVDDYSSPTIVNNLIARNHASSNGGGIYLDWYSTPSIINNTIVANNRGPGWANEGIFMYNSPSPVIVNNIIATHTHCIRGIPNSITLDYNLLWNCSVLGVARGPHDIYADPKLTTDYHLSINSPAINAGSGAFAPPTDFDDELRPAGTGYDIGADEYYGPALEARKQITPTLAHPGEYLTYTLHVTNSGTVRLTVFITDYMPEHVTPAGVLTWTPFVLVPRDVWTSQVAATIEEKYVGILTNVIEATSNEGATSIFTVSSQVNAWIYLPIMLRNN